jgi:tetratricopeptide (TPR) repeat protein
MKSQNSLLEFATRYRVMISIVALLASLVVLTLGLRQALYYTIPMLQGDYVGAAQSETVRPTQAWYDAALVSYKRKDYEAAKELLQLSYSSLSAEDGQLNSADNNVAAEVQFLLALTQEGLKQKRQAIDAYKQALRHNPDHLTAKYNLERLLKDDGGSSGGTGGEGDTPAPGSQAGKDGKKGI